MATAASPSRSSRQQSAPHRSRAELEILQPEFDRIGAGRGRHFVNEGFAAEQDRRTVGVAQVRRAQRRGAIHERRNDLPTEPPVVEGVGRDRDFETLAGIQGQPQQLPGAIQYMLKFRGVSSRENALLMFS